MNEPVSPLIQPVPFRGGQSVITENYQLLLEELPGLELAQLLHSNGILSVLSLEKIISRRTTEETNKIILESVQNAMLESESAFEQFLSVLQVHPASACIVKKLCESLERKETLHDEMEFKSSTSEVTPTSSGLQMKYTSNTRSSSSSSGYSFHSANSGEQISLLCSPDSTSALSTRFCTSLNDYQVSTLSQSKQSPANCPHLTSEECEVSAVAWCT